MVRNPFAPRYKLSKRKDRRTWQLSWSANGKRHRRSLGKIPKWLAEEKLKQIHTEALLGRQARSARPSSDLESFLPRYFEWARDVKHKSERSIVTDKTAIKQFLRYVAVQDLSPKFLLISWQFQG
jgi:hypothetical protein